MRAEIICVGTELLLGDILNTNAQVLSRALSEVGISVYNQQVVGDNTVRLRAAASLAKDRSDIVIFSGGLGPTKDDLTKETVAKVYNDDLILDKNVEQELIEYFKSRNIVMTDNNLKQAYVPRKGRIIKNRQGTAPGAIFIEGERMAVLLPGPPHEMETMLREEVLPILKKLTQGVIKSDYYSLIGVGESTAETMISALLEQENPTFALYAKRGEIQIRVTAKGKDEKEVDALLLMAKEQLNLKMGKFIYSDKNENLETALVNLLKEKGKTVATAESCTGGAVSQKLISVEGASSVFKLGLCPYTDAQKVDILGIEEEKIEAHSSVSSIIAQDMAINMLKYANADYTISTTGYAGPTGGSVEVPVGTVFICVANRENTYYKRLYYDKSSRADIMELASKSAINLLRSVILDLDMTGVTITPNDEAILEEIKNSHSKEPKKKKGSFIDAILKFILMILIGILVGIGWVYVANDFTLPRIDFSTVSREVGSFFDSIIPTSDVSIESVLNDRQDTDFFSHSFESDTLKSLSNLCAQNENVKGWISFKSEGIDIVVLDNKDETLSEINSAYKVESGMPSYTFLQGIQGENFINFLDIETARLNSKFVYFKDNEYKDYQIFAVGTYNDEELNQLLAMSTSEEIIISAKARSVFDVDVPVLDSDELVVLIQEVNNNEYIVLFSKEFTDSSFPSVDVKLMSVLSSWYIEDNNIQIDTSLEAMDMARESYDRDNYVWVNTGNEAVPIETPSSDSESEEVSGTQSPSPTKSPAPTASTSPTQSVSPTASALASQKPTATPKPSEGAVVTPTPSKTPTPEKTEEPQTGTSSAQPTQTPTPAPTPSEPMLTVTMNGSVVTDTVTNILSQIVALEMSSSWNQEALKAQAVAAHTYILYRQHYGDAAPAVVGRSSPAQNVINAVSQVDNIILTTNGSTPIYTPYTASAAGRTNASSEVWGGTLSHLVSVESKYDYQSPSYEVSTTLTKEQVEKIAENIGATLGEDPSTWFNIIDYTSGGYNYNMSLGDKTFTATKFKDTYLRDIGVSIRSSSFDIVYQNDTFTITTRAYGHGVGMSQWGAQLYAVNEGWNYQQILTHYYTGVQLTTIR